MKKKQKKHEKWVLEVISELHIGQYSRKPSLNCSMFSLYFSLRSVYFHLFNLVSCILFHSTVANRKQILNKQIETNYYYHSIILTFQIDIKLSDPDFPIPEKLYVSVLCFLTFNFCAMLGSLTTSWIQWVFELKQFFFFLIILIEFCFIGSIIFFHFLA